MKSLDKKSGQQTIPDPELEEEEEEAHQDWSQVASLVSKNAALSLPKRGEKDYEPDGTDLQELLLYEASKAMFDTISDSIRGNTVKSEVRGYYVPRKHQAFLPKPKGSFMQTMGRADSTGEYWLDFHEFVYLAERGTILPYYRLEAASNESSNHEIEILLSMEDLYSLFLSQQEMDQYFVFAHLKRLGFILKLCDQEAPVKTSFYPVRRQRSNLQTITWRLFSLFKIQEISLFSGFFYCKWNFFFRRYTKSPQLYQGLNRLVRSVAVPKNKKELLNAKFDGEFQKVKDIPATFKVWKPHANFKKRDPGLPDFQVFVYNKNDSLQHFPTYKELRSIFASLDYKFEFLNEVEDDLDWDTNSYVEGIPRREYNHNRCARSQTDKCKSSLKSLTKTSSQKNTVQSSTKKKSRVCPPHIQQNRRLKAGYRSFILAIMDNGLITFVKMSEADFGSENVWYTPNTQRKLDRKWKKH
ncbi:tRNA splicing endonuclease subunit SEN54 [Saccharomyces paradoxus]|uniref:tRNA splicing endonuclease subunit SEN54 n=1 Tax=Saccharomyces paradoxus TaxID=27291 RepID=A0A8B8V131_SACPA|nr:Sen54 [Saccharomyces paradoxus]QHS76651.1 Sen54 [Saccharomyces paradoxus]